MLSTFCCETHCGHATAIAKGVSKLEHKLFNMYNFRYDSSGRVEWYDGLFVGSEILH